MSDQDPIPRLPAEADTLLDGERRPAAAPDGARDRVRERLAATLGFPGGPSAPGKPAAPRPAPPSLPSPPASPVWLKLGGALAAAALVGGGLYALVGRPMRTAPAAPIAAASEPRPASPPPTVTSLAAPTQATPPVAAAPARVAPHPTSGGRSTDDLAAERALLDEARTDLAAGNAQEALQLLGEHGHRFPRGQLVEERESLAVRALADSGNAALARQRGTQFHVRFPHSIFLPAVDATLRSHRLQSPLFRAPLQR